MTGEIATMSEQPVNPEIIRLNIGCGTGKIDGFVNIDCDPELKPDRVYNIINELPFQKDTVRQIVMYHTIEHIPKCFWQGIFLDFSRVLEPFGQFWISYPEYTKVWDYWKTNFRGQREFWEACVFGRGSSQSDRHCSISDTEEIKSFLTRSGFEIYWEGNDGESHNTLLKCRNLKPLLYEDVLKERVWPTEQQFEQK